MDIKKLIRLAKIANRKAAKIYGGAPVEIRLYCDGHIEEREMYHYFSDDLPVIMAFRSGCPIWDDYDIEVRVRERASYI